MLNFLRKLKTPPIAPAPPVELGSSIVDVEAIRREARAEGISEALTVFERSYQAIERVTPAATPIPLTPANDPMGGKQTTGHGAYALNNPYTWAIPQAPYKKPDSLVSVQTLRTLADTYDVLRACINHLKREVRSVPFEIVARDKSAKPSRSLEKRVALAATFFERGGGVGGAGTLYRHFESKLFEDALIVGACANYHEYSRGGEWLQCDMIDASTIRPVTDYFGWAPTDPEAIAYEQWVMGVYVCGMRRRDLTYDGLHAASWQPYFMSPVEWLVRVINAAIQADNWNVTWLTDGTAPSDAYAAPKEWSADQVIQFATWWEALKSGNPSARQKTAFLPGGTTNIGTPSRKDQDFQQYELWLLRRTCSIMGVAPASIGYSGEQYKVSQDASMSQTTEFGAGDLLTLRKAILDDILERVGFGDLEVVDVSASQETAKDRAATNQILISSGQRTINEVRKADGEDPIEGGDVVLVANNLAPLDQVSSEPEPQPAIVPPADPAAVADPKARGEGSNLRILRVKSLDSAVSSYRAAMLAHEATATAETLRHWQAVEESLLPAFEALLEQMEEHQLVGGATTPEQIAALSRYQSLLATITEQINLMASRSSESVASAQDAGTQQMLTRAQELVRSALGTAPKDASFTWSSVPVQAIENLIGFAGDGSPLRDLFAAIGPQVATRATEVLVSAMAAGENPRALAPKLAATLGVSRARAENIARTETLRALREATRQSYLANTDVVGGWVWHSACQTTTCAACWAMHGTTHDSTESMAAHCQCRCSMVPLVLPYSEILGDDSIPDERPTIETGESAFSRLDASQQKAVLGPGLYQLFSDGTLPFSDLVVIESDPRWGSTVRPITLDEAKNRMAGGGAAKTDLRKWQAKTLKRLREGKPALVPFASNAIPKEQLDRLFGALAVALAKPATPDTIRAIFAQEMNNL